MPNLVSVSDEISAFALHHTLKCWEISNYQFLTWQIEFFNRPRYLGHPLTRTFFRFPLEFELTGFYCIIVSLAFEQALLFGRVKRVSRERASERRSREGQRKGPSLARSREAHFVCPNRRACSQAIVSFALAQYTLKRQTNGICVVMIYLYSFPHASRHITF